MSDEMQGATDPGPDHSYPATPGEFAARWNAWDDDYRMRWLLRAVADSNAAGRCLVEDHAGQIGFLRENLARVQEHLRHATAGQEPSSSAAGS